MHGHEIPSDDHYYREAIPEGPPSDRAITTRMSRWRWLWITLLIVFVGIAAIAVWQVFFDDDLTVTFDGTSATYEGHTAYEAPESLGPRMVGEYCRPSPSVQGACEKAVGLA